MQSSCFAHKGWIYLQQTRKAITFNRRNLGPLHTYPDIYFLKSDIYLSILAFRPHVIGIFGRRRSRFSQMFPRVEILEKDVRMDEYRGLRIQHCACSVNGCYSYFNHFSVFMWTGEKDSNTLRVDAYFGYVWTGPYCF